MTHPHPYPPELIEACAERIYLSSPSYDKGVVVPWYDLCRDDENTIIAEEVIDCRRAAIAALSASGLSEMREALAELVELKDLKDEGDPSRAAEYAERKPAAWTKARAELAKWEVKG